MKIAFLLIVIILSCVNFHRTLSTKGPIIMKRLPAKRTVYAVLAVVGAFLLAGCSSGNGNSPFNSDTGHPVGWADPASHGTFAKADSAGFESCRSCHGSDFSGGISGTSCFGCHGVNAPHAPAPWRDGTRTHTTTNQENAAVCALCHAGGANSSVSPNPMAPAGTAPGCFNSTLCHGLAGHPSGWSSPDQHGFSAEQDFSVCKACHGTDYKGGAATTTCYDCHNGPGLNHPTLAWVVAEHKAAAISDSTGCRKCHGADYLGGGAHVACTTCHMENPTKVHPLSWYPDVRSGHQAYAATNGTAACANASCHGTALTGVALSGPSCSTCHGWPFSGGTCGSCHGIPPNGTSTPNTAGAHAAHAALNGSITCTACHKGAGSGTALHRDGTVEVAIDSVYNAKGGAAVFNSATKTCSNVACHGGPRTQTAAQAGARQSSLSSTPGWISGSINVNTQCAGCHVLGLSAGSPENSSYYSGRHYLHVYEEGKACTVCHNTTALASVHFTSLTDPLSSSVAAATLNSSIRFNGTSCNPSSGGMTGCHGAENW